MTKATNTRKAAASIRGATLATVNKRIGEVTVAVMAASKGEGVAVSAVDAALTAAKSCPATEKNAQDVVRDTTKAAYIASRLARLGNMTADRALDGARVILSSANSKGTGKLKQGQKRRTVEEDKAYLAAGVYWSRLLGQTSHGPVKAASNGNKGKGKGKGKTTAPKPAEKTVPLASVAKFVPPARKDLSLQSLAAWLQSQAANAVAQCEALNQKAHKTGEPAVTLELANAAAAFREAVNAAVKHMG